MMEVYTSDSSDSDSRELKTLNYSRLELTPFALEATLLQRGGPSAAGGERPARNDDIETVLLAHNRLRTVPLSISRFVHLHVLDVSANGLTELPDFLATLPLTSLIAKNNALGEGSLPKTLLSRTGVLRELNLSGNRFVRFPEQILELHGLKYLYLGGNKIGAIPRDVWKVQR